MTLNTFYQESFKKWLKGKCSDQANSVSNIFEDGEIKAIYDAGKEAFILASHGKECPKEHIKQILDNEEEFNTLVSELIKN